MKDKLCRFIDFVSVFVGVKSTAALNLTVSVHAFRASEVGEWAGPASQPLRRTGKEAKVSPRTATCQVAKRKFRDYVVNCQDTKGSIGDGLLLYVFIMEWARQTANKSEIL